MSTTLSIGDQIANAVILHEGGTLNTLGLAPTGKSGYSIGLTQYDFAQAVTSTGIPTAAGQEILNEFASVLTDTQSVTGLSDDQINTIVTNIYSQHGSDLIVPLIRQVNAALSTPEGLAFVQSVDTQDLQVDTTAVEDLIAAGSEYPDATEFSNGNLDPQVVAELAAYVNVFGTSNPSLTEFLSTGSTILPNGIEVTSDGTLSVEDINTNFLPYLDQYIQNPQQLSELIQSSAKAASYADQNEIDWDKTFSTPTLVVAANGVTTTTFADESGTTIATEASYTDASGDIISTYTVAGEPPQTTVLTPGAAGSLTQTISVQGHITEEQAVSGSGASATVQFNTTGGSGSATIASNGTISFDGTNASISLSALNTIEISGSSLCVGLSTQDTIDLGPGTVGTFSGQSGTFNLEAGMGDILAVPGQQADTFDIQQNLEPAAQWGQDPDVIWGGGGVSTYNFTGLNEVVFVNIPDLTPSELEALPESEWDTIASNVSGYDDLSFGGPVTIIVDPSPGDKFELNGIAISGGSINSSEQGYFGGPIDVFGYADNSDLEEYSQEVNDRSGDPTAHLRVNDQSADGIVFQNFINGVGGINLSGGEVSSNTVPELAVGAANGDILTASADVDTLTGGGFDVDYDVGSDLASTNGFPAPPVTTIYNQHASTSSTPLGTLAFGSGIDPSEIGPSAFPASGLDLAFVDTVTGQVVNVVDGLDPSSGGIAEVTFADGTSWTYADVLAMLESPTGAGAVTGSIAGDTTANVLDSQGLVRQPKGGASSNSTVIPVIIAVSPTPMM